MCDDERCTGNHNDRKYATLCPRTKENKSRQWRKSHPREQHAERNRRYRMTAAGILNDARQNARRRGGSRDASVVTD